MTLRTWRYAALVITMGAGLVACGDDDGDRPPLRDAGNGGLDGGGDDTDGGGGGDPDGGGGGDPDGGGGRVCSLPGGECDVIAQDCGGTQGCYVLITSEGGEPTTVCDTAGAGTDGSACTTYSQCQPGLTCDMDSMTCRRYCCGGLTSDCPSGTGQICITFSNAMPAGICTAPTGCTVVPQSGCGAGQGCYWISDDFATDCRAIPDGSVAVGATCTTTPGSPWCVPGAGCLTSGGATEGTCRAFCQLGGTGECGGGLTCTEINGVPAGVGACLPAASGS